MTPLEVVARCRENGTTLTALRRALPADLLEQSPARAWFAIVRSCALIAIGELELAHVHIVFGASALWAVPALVFGWLVVASGMVGLFIIGHDCGHDAFSRRRWVNTLVGHLCMSPILTGFHNWRISHNHHHARSQLRGDDTDWPERMLTREEYAKAPFRQRLETMAAYASPAGILLGFIVGMVRRTAMGSLYPQVKLGARARRDLAVSNVAALGVSGGIAAALLFTIGAAGLAKHYLAPLYVGMILGAFFTYLHHSGEGALAFERDGWSALDGQVASTFDVRFPAWFEALFFHINRHPPHHLAPRIPWYHLARAMDVLQRAHPELHLERRFSIGYLLRSWRAPLLEPVASGVFVVAPRSAAHGGR